MANHKATKKAIRKTIRTTLINKSRKSRVKTFLKKIDSTLKSNYSTTELNLGLIEVQAIVMKAAAKKIMKKNTASRKISRLVKKIKKAHISVSTTNTK